MPRDGGPRSPARHSPAERPPGYSYTQPFNLSGLPVAVVRCGTAAGGLPIGVQVVAGPWREDVALAAAGALERALGGWRPPPETPGG